MGYLVWAALTALALWASLSLVLRISPGLPLAEQIVASCVAAVALVIIPIQALGYLSVLYGPALGACVALESALVLAATRDKSVAIGAWASGLGLTARRTLSAPVTALVSAAALLLVVLFSVYAVLFPSWNWDAMWYHDPITAYAFQEHSLAWVDTWIPFVNSYPKIIELLALWNGIFTSTDALIDWVQLPMLLVGITALAAICRRAGAEGSLAWGLALVFMFLPAVYLNTPSNYVDVAAASLWLASVLFLCRVDATWSERLWGSVALGLYLGSKVTGALHAALVAPVVLVSLIRGGLRGSWKSSVKQGAAMVGIVLGLGGVSYIRDLVRYGNPVWPAQVKVPFLNKALPGDWAVTSFTTPPYGGPDDLKALWRSFNDAHPNYLVDVRVAGFGSLWVYLLIPMIGLAVVLWGIQLWRTRTLPPPALLPLVMLLATAMVTPAKWWPRYVLGFPAAGLLAAAMVLRRVPFRILAQGALALIMGWALWQLWPARNGIFGRKGPEQLWTALHLSSEERATQRFDSWQQEHIALRDQLVQPGEASVYDTSTSFVYQLWRPDWKNRVLWKPFHAPAEQWLAELDRERVRWASISRNSEGGRALRQAGWKFLWPCEAEGCEVWVREGELPAVDQAR